ncbi:hypothetical protein RvY_14090 [Ramazzottius varieornatus]|uniref:Uncharacterized protein n=1 Tax=Ramazzottius varieornatus TaxID=947166 RepID=A0A1D1VRU8_RAMVA|nr:hypothetical protein RvY_14090 [Ramazzottius varieornatus]
MLTSLALLGALGFITYIGYRKYKKDGWLGLMNEWFGVKIPKPAATAAKMANKKAATGG